MKKRIRTLAQAAAHFKALDPDTAVTKHFLRVKILSGEIHCVMAGKKRLIAIEDIETFFVKENVVNGREVR